MRIIRCTAKLLKELGNPLFADTIAETEGLEKLVSQFDQVRPEEMSLFTNEKTLYSFLIQRGEG